MGNVSEQLTTQKHSDDMKPSIKGTEFHSDISSHLRTRGRLSQEHATKAPSTKVPTSGSILAVSRRAPGAQDHPLEGT